MELSKCTIVLEEAPAGSVGAYSDTPLPFAGTAKGGFPQRYQTAQRELSVPEIPEKICEMIRIYEYGDGSLAHKAKIFYRQGKFMEDYEDHEPWQGAYRRYFTTYHDLNVRQLRGYFTWRTYVRKGEYRSIAASLAYLYLYELLCGIGTASAEDTLCKMKAFEVGFLDSGIGDPGMRHNLRRWMFEYAVLHGIPSEMAIQYADPAILEKDGALAVLKDPKQHTDEEIFTAICTFAGKKLQESPVVAKDESKGRHLFAEVWRYLSENYDEGGRTIFSTCFGERKSYIWHPLSNAVYWEEYKSSDMDFVLDECRSYHLRNGVWQEKRYDKLYFDSGRFCGVFHEADRLFRRALKTGRYLRENPEDAWASPYIHAVLEAERRAEIEAAKPKITINFSGLERIRQDALVTRDSLLTDEETAGEAEPVALKERQNDENNVDGVLTSGASFDRLDALHLRLLTLLLRGQSIEELIKTEHLMPSVVTDTINGALFDEIGDNILECDGDQIFVVEDYREDIMEILGDGIL